MVGAVVGESTLGSVILDVRRSRLLHHEELDFLIEVKSVLAQELHLRLDGATAARSLRCVTLTGLSCFIF